MDGFIQSGVERFLLDVLELEACGQSDQVHPQASPTAPILVTRSPANWDQVWLSIRTNPATTRNGLLTRPISPLGSADCSVEWRNHRGKLPASEQAASPAANVE